MREQQAMNRSDTFDAERLRQIISVTFENMLELEAMSPRKAMGTRWHAVSFIGAALYQYWGHFATGNVSPNEHTVPDAIQVHATKGDSIVLANEPYSLVVVQFYRDGTWAIVYSGSGKVVWDYLNQFELAKHESYTISLTKLHELGKGRRKVPSPLPIPSYAKKWSPELPQIRNVQKK